MLFCRYNAFELIKGFPNKTLSDEKIYGSMKVRHVIFVILIIIAANVSDTERMRKLLFSWVEGLISQSNLNASFKISSTFCFKLSITHFCIKL